MNALLLRLVHSVEHWLDAQVLKGHTGRRAKPALLFAMILLAGVGLLIPALNGLSGHKKASDVVDPYNGYFKALPDNTKFDGVNVVYSCSGGEHSKTLTNRFYSYSHIFEKTLIQEKLIENNPGAFRKDYCVSGSKLTIPSPLLEPIVNHPLGRIANEKAIYLRGENTVPGRVAREMKKMKAAGVTAVVFDVKDIVGLVNYKSNLEEVEKFRRHPAPIPDLAKTIRYFHENGIYVIARQALFQDENLSLHRPDLAIKDGNSPTGTLLFKGRPVWVDPAADEIRAYNLRVALEIALLGVDEIQFDYVRYPAEGNLDKVTYQKIRTHADKTAFLKSFLGLAQAVVHPFEVRTSIDIFGVVAWGEEIDIRTTGQRIEELSEVVDVISPMLYPSHFDFGFDGFAKPADQGFYFYEKGVQRVLERAKPGVQVRPWIQAFKWRVSNYNPTYIRDQIRGTEAANGHGWLMWNASNDYDVVYRALAGNKSALVSAE